MYNTKMVDYLIEEITNQSGKLNKDELSGYIKEKFSLVQDRKVFSGEYFTIRFSAARKKNPSNTILALAKLKIYDNKPFFVCIVTPVENVLLLANSTFLKKVSHSSQNLSMTNIKGSFNASDIQRAYDGLGNEPVNFERLFWIHAAYSFEDNLERLVAATNKIVPTGKRYTPTEAKRNIILESPWRVLDFMKIPEYKSLKADLDQRVENVREELYLIQKQVDNVNVRGRLIEYFITSDDEMHKKKIMQQIKNKKPIDDLVTDDALGDYSKKMGKYHVETDIKSKLLQLTSNPKGYNVDKLLRFLSEPDSIYLLYIVAMDDKCRLYTELTSVFQKQILDHTRIQKHWSGRNSRGVAQLDGHSLGYFIDAPEVIIEAEHARNYLQCLLDDSFSAKD